MSESLENEVKELILRHDRLLVMEDKGSKVLIFPDCTNEVMTQRRAQDGGMPTVFDDPKEVAQFLESNSTRKGE